jgi:hypothetical protein
MVSNVDRVNEHEHFLLAALLDDLSDPIGDVLERHPSREVEREILGSRLLRSLRD